MSLFVLLRYRCHIQVHLGSCKARMKMCGVRGCHAVKRLQQTAEHDVDAASTHKRLQDAEIQRLRRAIMEKVRHPIYPCLTFLIRVSNATSTIAYSCRIPRLAWPYLRIGSAIEIFHVSKLWKTPAFFLLREDVFLG